MNIKIGKAKTVLLLHMNGTNGSQSFVDSSRNNCSVSPFHDAQISTAQSKFGGASAAFDDYEGYLEIANRPDFGFGTGDFTAECWIYFNEVPNEAKGIINLQSSGSFTFYYDGGTYQSNYLVISNRLTNQISYGWTPTINTWYHLAVSRSGGFLRLFINGNMVSQVADSTNYNSGDVNIGGDANEGEAWTLDGYIDELRMIKGAGVYTSNFTPPTSEFLIDSSSLSITKGGSGKLNEKKYIDLLPPNFISKVTLSGGDYSNGTYTRSSRGATTFDGPDGKTIVFSNPIWYAYDPSFNGGVDPTYASLDLINWNGENASGVPTGVTENSLSFLFDPIFYKNQIENERYKILLQGCSLPYVNGIYSLSLSMGLVGGGGYYIKDDDNVIIYYEIETGRWVIEDTNYRDYGGFLFYKIGGASSTTRPADLDWSIPDGGDAYDDNQTPPTMSEYLNLQYKNGGRLDPAFLEQIRDYQIDNAIPNASVTNNLNPSSPQHIVGAAFNTKKAEIKNNTFSYIKYSDNTDVEQKKLNKWYKSISGTQGNYSINPPKDSKYPLLRVRRNDSQPIFEIGSGKNYTLNMFIRLQRPVSHKNPNTGYIVREKRGIFCTAYSPNDSRPFSIGYRSPYYNITGRPSYKSVFNNFSFVFSFGSVGYDAGYGRPISKNLMTDYKFNFGEMYMLTIHSENNYLQIYVNGELQNPVANVPFNPLVNPSSKVKPYVLTLSGGTYSNGTYEGGFGSAILYGPDGKYIELSSPLIDSGAFGGDFYAVDPAHPNFPDYVYTSASEGIFWYDDGNVPNAGTPPNGVQDLTLQFKKLYKTRRDEMPLGPGFYKKDGTVYTDTDYITYAGIGNILSINELIFGKSSLAHGMRNFNSKKKRRYLNNLDIGVITSHSAALSQSDISQIYNNFRYRYI